MRILGYKSLFLSIIIINFSAQADSVLVTISEDPGQQSSTLSGVNEYTFNALSVGNHSNIVWDNVGTFDELLINPGYSVFGAYDENTGSNSNFLWNGTSGWGGNYDVVQATTLTLDQSSSYFGFYWAAGDSNDLLRFYDDTDLVAEYNTRSIVLSANLGDEYYGDPTFNVQMHEPYAFVNFYGDENTTWDSIVFSQSSNGGGFETDNFTTRIEAFDPDLDNIEDLGVIISEVTGSVVSNVDEDSGSWGWAASQAPGAPVPGVYALIIFMAAFLGKNKVKS